MIEKSTYDVLISYSSKDKAIVYPLAERLRDDGLKIWLDAWVLQPGDPIGIKIQHGLENAHILLMCMSKSYFASEWAKLEHHTLLFRDPTNEQRRFVPLLLEDCKRPDVIAQFLHIDWRGREDAAYLKILSSCRLPKTSDPSAFAKATIGRNANSSDDSIATITDAASATASFYSLAISPDGQRAVSVQVDGSLKVWDLEKQCPIAPLNLQGDAIVTVAIGAEGRRAVLGSHDGVVAVWNLENHHQIARLGKHAEPVYCVAFSANGQRAVSTIKLGVAAVWDLESRRAVGEIGTRAEKVHGVAIDAEGRRAVSGSHDGVVAIWDLENYRRIAKLGTHTKPVYGVAISADGQRAVSTSSDRTLKFWDIEKHRLIATLEGHHDSVGAAALFTERQWAVSASSDGTLTIWDLEKQRPIATLGGHRSPVYGVAVSADGRRIVSASMDRALKIWDLTALETGFYSNNIANHKRYTNAKVVLVGESGVGKSGLALRLAEDDWIESSSTHGMTVSKLDLPSASEASIEREVWLWDFAGQPDYRLIHQLYMDETTLALMVVDPQKDDPFAPLGHWEKAIKRAVKPDPAKLLVAARCDRGSYIVGKRDIDEYLAGRGYAAHVNTSAKLPDDPGCRELRQLIAKHIPWDRLPSISTTKLFKALKDAVIEIKECGIVLIRVVELEQRLRLGWRGEPFDEQDLRTVIGLLAGQGLIQPLDFGDFVLLQPEQINNYGSAVVRAARNSETELAELSELEVLGAEIDFEDMERLKAGDETILLRAMLQTFFDRSLCLRVDTPVGVKLVFPAYFKQDRPNIPEQPQIKVTYGFTGPIDEIYTTLIVRLHYSHDFESDRLWRYAAEFNAFCGGRVGLLLTKERDETAKIQAYFDGKTTLNTEVLFIKYIHEHLKRHAEDVTRVRDYVCPHCNTPVENKKSVAKKLHEGKTDIICVDCEERVPLIDMIEEKFASDEFLQNVRKMDEQAQISLDNESLELILVGHAFSTIGEAGHIFRPITNSDHGVDGEIEFKNEQGKASGQRLYLQLKSGDSYLRHRKRDGAEIFDIKNPRHTEYWQAHEYPVMLVIRGSDEKIRWMNVTDYLKRCGDDTRQIIFEGEPFTAVNIHKMWRQMTGSKVYTNR